MSVIKDFGTFIKKGNVVDLAVAVVIGAAFGKIVSAAVSDLVMPLVNAVVPQGDWRKWEVSPLHFRVGDFLGTVVDFLIVALVVFMVMVKLVGAATRKTRPPPSRGDQDLPGVPGDGSDRGAALPGLHQRARGARGAQANGIHDLGAARASGPVPERAAYARRVSIDDSVATSCRLGRGAGRMARALEKRRSSSAGARMAAPTQVTSPISAARPNERMPWFAENSSDA